MRTYFAIDAQPQTAKIQDRLIAVDLAKAVQTSISLAAAKPLQTSDPSASKPESDVTEVEVFSVSNIHPTDGFVTAPARHPASATQSDTAISSTSSSQSRTAAGPHLVPLTKRKPKRPIAKETQSNTAESRAKANGIWHHWLQLQPPTVSGLPQITRRIASNIAKLPELLGSNKGARRSRVSVVAEDRDKPIYHAACNNEALADEHTVFRKTIRHLRNNISQRVALPHSQPTFRQVGA